MAKEIPDWKKHVADHLRGLGLSAEREMEIIEELATHLNDVYQEALSDGQSADVAEEMALAQVADWPLLQTELSKARQRLNERLHKRSEKVEDHFVDLGAKHRLALLFAYLVQDVRYGLRLLGRKPGFTAVVVLTLALGLGAQAAIFSVVAAVLLRPLPYPQAERLTTIFETDAQRKITHLEAAGLNYHDWQSQAQSFESMAAYLDSFFTISGNDTPERVRGVSVTADFFPTLGIHPAAGRAFAANEIQTGDEPVVIIGHALWQRQFGGDADFIGRTIQVNGKSLTVIGIMPKDLQFPESAELWAPAPPPHQFHRNLNMFNVIARLKPTVTLEQARTELAVIAAGLEQQYPDTNKGKGVGILSLHEEIVGDVKPSLLILLAAVGFLLLIACANVANMLLVRSTGRQQEMAVRAALGAGRRRLMMQMLTESLVLGLLGGAVGLVMAYLGTQLLLASHATLIPRAHEIRFDGWVFGFNLLVAVLIGMLFGLLPALRMSRPNLQVALQTATRSLSGGMQRMFNALTVAEIALALVLMIGAGLLIKSLWQLLQVNPGFDTENVLTFQLQLPEKDYAQSAKKIAFSNQLLSLLQSLPAVESVGAVNRLPLNGVFMSGLMVSGAPPVTAAEQLVVAYRVATPDYFAALGIPLLRGRHFGDFDHADAERVAMIDEATAKRFWPDEDAIGKQISFPQAKGTGPWVTIVGVVGDVRYHGLPYKVFPTVYVPYAQAPSLSLMLAVRTSSDPLQLAPLIREQVRKMDGNLAVSKLMTTEQLLGDSIADRRLNLILFNAFAGLALALAAIGIYGVVSYSVAQRTKEIGIRIALGARPPEILKLVFKQGSILTLTGVALGLLGAFALTRLMSSLLFGVSATDLTIFVTVSVVSGAAALLACYLPARRATKVDPMIALRYE